MQNKNQLFHTFTSGEYPFVYGRADFHFAYFNEHAKWGLDMLNGLYMLSYSQRRNCSDV